MYSNNFGKKSWVEPIYIIFMHNAIWLCQLFTSTEVGGSKMASYAESVQGGLSPQVQNQISTAIAQGLRLGQRGNVQPSQDKRKQEFASGINLWVLYNSNVIANIQ